MTPLDQALTALRVALTAAGAPLWTPPDTFAAIDELEAEIAPLRLPADVREFWRRVDTTTLHAEPYPPLIRPQDALVSWRQARDEFASMEPLSLLLVGYESHECMSVELGDGEIEGGALFEWFLSDPSGFDRRFNSLPDWLAHVAGLIAQGWYERREGPRGPRLLVPAPDRVAEEAKARRPPGPHPVHGATLHIPADILEWPDHWRRANGVRPDHTTPRGATHTIAEVLASPPDTELRATIAARVSALAGSAAAVRARVHDGTAELDVFCPAGTTLLGPRLGSWFEFDVIVPPGARHVPADPNEAEQRADGDVEKLAAVLRARHGGPVGATAEAVRRLPAP